MTIQELSKEYGRTFSNKGCSEQCEGCWQRVNGFGCEQYNMEQAYIAGATYVINEIQSILTALHEDKRSIFAWGYVSDKLKELLSFIEALPEEAVSEDLERVAQAHAVLFKSELYFSLDKEQEKLWIKDIEDTFKEGAQWKEENMIAKSCEWLYGNLHHYWSQKGAGPTKFIKKFRKAMEK